MEKKIGKIKGFFAEFKKFITRGNVLDMAVGVIIGGAFTAIVNGLSNYVLKPIINWLIMLMMGPESAGGGLSGAVTFLPDGKVYKDILDESGAIIGQEIDMTASLYIDWGSLISAILNFSIQKRAEFKQLIAYDTRIWRTSRIVGVYEITNHGGVELVLKIIYSMLDAQPVANYLGIGNVLRSKIVPILVYLLAKTHGCATDLISLLKCDKSRHSAIYSAAHGNGKFLFVSHNFPLLPIVFSKLTYLLHALEISLAEYLVYRDRHRV